MPSRLTRRDRKLFAVTGALALVAILLAAIFGGDEDESPVPTTYSAESAGAKAAFLLLRDAGYSTSRWERSPTRLEQGPATLIFAEPSGVPTTAERAAITGFIEGGGRVIVTGASSALFVPDTKIVSDARAAVTFTRVNAAIPSPITRAAPEISLDLAAHWDGPSAVALYADDQPRVVRYTVGRGDVIWWASSTPLTNAGITEPGNLEFFLASLGDRSRPILWDEYFHGYRGEPIAKIARTSPFRLLMVPIGLMLVAVLVTYSRRSGPIVPLEQESRLSPLEFVRTLGALYQHAGAGSVALDVAYARFRYRLARRLGVASSATVDDLERAARARFHLKDSRLGDLLRECEAARQQRLAAPRALQLTQALADHSAELGLS